MTDPLAEILRENYEGPIHRWLLETSRLMEKCKVDLKDREPIHEFQTEDPVFRGGSLVLKETSPGLWRVSTLGSMSEAGLLGALRSLAGMWNWEYQARAEGGKLQKYGMDQILQSMKPEALPMESEDDD